MISAAAARPAAQALSALDRATRRYPARAARDAPP
ncbi:hypothetical protein SCE1572_02365 [Sorangium cellulosum So0157-2]|uniref:Uncharacterized protein n=1 Tax=Sorangium cellulosum So0157-2 TaxID=1254432 RepID=S4XLZ4_SORCE|nr:hypothetical protein SCE1572_02365 [Sorangium cellulosum So0157-2]